jgi:hypothetical protein
MRRFANEGRGFDLRRQGLTNSISKSTPGDPAWAGQAQE